MSLVTSPSKELTFQREYKWEFLSTFCIWILTYGQIRKSSILTGET